MDIIQEVSQNFIDSAYDTNTNRAFPDARDGLKPGMRACLWEMYTKGYTSNNPHVKSAKIDGGVAALWWPHGTTAIYETFARMSQPFTNNVPEVDFHGANGNVILGGGAIAADRYSEARLSRMTEKYMLDGVEKNAVDMIWNFSEDEKWPSVLPAVFPRLLVNGSQGIGVSIANSWACHNLSETCKVLENYMDSNIVDNDNYLPDWPCGATIVNRDELPQINKTGQGKIITEAKYEIVGKEIHFTEFPYQVYIEPLIDEIKDAIEKDKVHNVVDVFNKSDKRRILLTVTCSSAAKVKSVLQELLSSTSLRSQFNVNQVAIVGKTPKLLTLEDMCRIYVSHNLSCIKREYEYDLAKTLDRIEILEGLAKALGDIDGLIRLIKNSESAAKAKEKLLGYDFTERQADAILAMKLSRLAHLEVDSVLQELKEKRSLADSLRFVIDSECEQKKILCERLQQLAKEFGGPRRTQVIQKEIVKPSNVKKKDEPQDVVFCLDENAYAKVVPLGKFHTNESNVREDKTRTDKLVILYSNRGRAYRLKVDAIKPCLNSEKGTAIGPLLELAPDEKIVDFSVNAACPALIMVTKSGRVKVMEAKHIDGTTQNKRGIPMMKLDEEDEIVYCSCIDDKSFVEIRSSGLESRKAIFQISDITPTGKSSSGRIGIKLKDGEHVSYVRLLEDVDKRRISRLGTRGAKM